MDGQRTLHAISDACEDGSVCLSIEQLARELITESCRFSWPNMNKSSRPKNVGEEFPTSQYGVSRFIFIEESGDEMSHRVVLQLTQSSLKTEHTIILKNGSLVLADAAQFDDEPGGEKQSRSRRCLTDTFAMGSILLANIALD